MTPRGGQALACPQSDCRADVVGQLGVRRPLHQALGQLCQQPAGPGDLLLRRGAGEQLVDHLITDPPVGRHPQSLTNPTAVSRAAHGLINQALRDRQRRGTRIPSRSSGSRPAEEILESISRLLRRMNGRGRWRRICRSAAMRRGSASPPPASSIPTSRSRRALCPADGLWRRASRESPAGQFLLGSGLEHDPGGHSARFDVGHRLVYLVERPRLADHPRLASGV